MFKKKNAPLIIGFSMPILMILFVAASIYLPGIFQHPSFNFLYSTGGDYYDNQTFSVSNGRLIINPQPTIYPTNRLYIYPSQQIYIYTVSSNESKPVSLQDAENLNLNPNVESPDGYKLENGNQSDGFFPFFWYDRNYNAQYLVGHNFSRKLNVISTSSTYYNSIHFLGWIM